MRTKAPAGIEMPLEDQIAVVTGAAGGIGAAIAHALAARGAQVAAFDINAIAPHERIHGFRCDVTDTAAVRAACAEVAKQLGPVSILVNNAGGSGAIPIEQIDDVSDEVWEGILSLNL